MFCDAVDVRISMVKYKRIGGQLLRVRVNYKMQRMQIESESKGSGQQSPKRTLGSLIDSIEFVKKSKNKSETDSISSNHSVECKEKSKVWTEEEVDMFHILLRKFGTDFHILSNFFPKKTKNQLKNRYKQYVNGERKKEKKEMRQYEAIGLMFKEAQEKEEKDDDREDRNESEQMASKFNSQSHLSLKLE